MSRLVLTEGVDPSAPAASKQSIFADSADKLLKSLRADGLLEILSARLGVNFLGNSGFWYAQRQVPATLTTYSNTTGRSYGADRWGLTNENASIQYQRVDTAGAVEAALPGRYYGKFKKLTSAGKMVVSQVLEGGETGPLRGLVVRVQAKMRYTVAASMTVRLGLLYLTAAGTIDTIPATFVAAFGAAGTDPTWGANLTAIAPTLPENGTVSGTGLTCVLTAGWVRYSACFLVPTDAKNVIPVIWTNGQPAANDELNIADAGLYIGEGLRDFVPEPLALELARAQRYYAKTFNVDTNPAASAGVATGELRFPSPVTASTLFGIAVNWRFPVPMFKAPAVTTFNPSAAGAQVRNITLGTDCTLTATTVDGEQSVAVGATTPAATVQGANILGVHLTADAEL